MYMSYSETKKLEFVHIIPLRRHKEIRSIIAFSAQPASPSHPLPQGGQSGRPPRWRGIPHNAL